MTDAEKIRRAERSGYVRVLDDEDARNGTPKEESDRA
jgi:hypothetical protein